jgi:hypothetical protein
MYSISSSSWPTLSVRNFIVGAYNFAALIDFEEIKRAISDGDIGR